MKTKKIRKVLEDAITDGTALKFRRRYCDYNECGYPVGIGDEWTLFHSIAPDVMTLNGYQAFRIDDLEMARSEAGFLMRALSALGESSIYQPEIILTDLSSLLQSANDRFPLVNIHLEARRPGVCYVGRIAKMGKNRVHLWDITPKARWRKSTYRYPLEDITLVEFGDGYTNALWMLGQQEWLARQEK